MSKFVTEKELSRSEIDFAFRRRGPESAEQRAFSTLREAMRLLRRGATLAEGLCVMASPSNFRTDNPLKNVGIITGKLFPIHKEIRQFLATYKGEENEKAI